MAAKYKTSLSVGADVRASLLDDPDVSGITEKIFPVVTDEAVLPYVVYRRAEMEEKPVKARAAGSDAVNVEVACYTQGYADGVELAEAVRHALEASRRLRGCLLVDSQEAYEAEAYIQLMTFRILI